MQHIATSVINKIIITSFLLSDFSSDLFSSLETVKTLALNLSGKGFGETKKGIVNIDWKEDKGFYQFSIQDNGIGIAKEHFGLVFEAFKKLNNRTDSYGIGLFIIKKVITSGGGKIWIESEKGVGTTFFFTIPK